MHKLLLVEDDEMSRDMLTKRLKKSGFEVILAENGVEAIDVARTKMPDLILMDIRMPLLDGWKAIEHIRTDAKTSKIPIIVITAYSDPDNEAKAHQSQFEGYESKPIDFPKLLNKIKSLL